MSFCSQSASEFELLSEIHFSDVLIFENVLGRPGCDQAAVTQYIGMTTNTECFSHIVVGYQNTDVALAQMPNNALNIEHGYWVDTREGFIEKDKLWVRGEGTRNFYATTLTTGQTDTQACSHVPDMQFVKQRFQLLFAASPVATAVPSDSP